MRIIQINSCHYRRGGADVVYLNTGRLLNEKGHEVFYFSQENDKNISTKSSLYFVKETNYFKKSLAQKIASVPRFFYSFEAKNSISKLIKDYPPDLAHIHLYKADLTPSILGVLKKKRIPVVLTLHDYGLLCPHNLMLDGKMNICNRCTKGSALNCIIHKCNRNNLVLSSLSAMEFIFQKTFFPLEKYFDKIIAVSKFGQKLHNSSSNIRNEILHLYNFYPNLNDVEPISEKGQYMLYFGRLSHEKGIKTLLTAWLQRERDAILKVVGTGELYEELKSQAKSEQKIQILGYKAGEELDNLIRYASFIIVPSEWYENNPLTIIEAYANGKPVIGSNIGGIPEIVEDGRTGFLFEMKNIDDLSHKLNLAEDLSEMEYKKMSSNARAFAQIHFNPESHYKKLIEIYKETLNSKNNAKE